MLHGLSISELADELIQGLPQEILDHHIVASDDPSWGQGPTFDDKAIECIADAFQELIASTIAKLIDAGSERDAIMEDEQLANALRTTLKDW